MNNLTGGLRGALSATPSLRSLASIHQKTAQRS